MPGQEGQLDAARLLAVIETQNEIAATALDVDAVMAFVAERARELTGASGSVIEVPEGDEMVYRFATGSVAGHVGFRVAREHSLSGRCLQEQRVLYSEDTANDERVMPEFVRQIGARSMICVPLRHDATVAGVLKVVSDRPHAFGDRDAMLLGLLSGVVAAHMSHATNFEIVQRQSREDPLTALGNRRAFEEALAESVRLARRKLHPLALCLVDVDHFKRVNDDHGHPAGDRVLGQIANILRAGRAGDHAYRIGGDEFALVMPDTTLAGAEVVAARLTSMVAAAPLGDVRVTVSAGVAESGEDGADHLFASADAALYRAKAGRP